jgi:Nuclease-related domain
MGQHSTPDPDPDKDDDLEGLGAPVYEGSGLSVRALTAEELQRFLDAHHGQPTQPLGSGWAILDPPGHPAGVPWAAPEPALALPGPPRSTSVEPAEAAAGSAGRSALAQYRRRRSQELAAWTRSLVWRAPLVAAAGLTGSALATQAGLARTLPAVVGLAAAVLVGWWLRFRPSPQARAWQRGASGERRTARLLDRLGRDGYQVFHDLAMPGSPANIDHLVVGPSGVFVIDSKQWTGSVQQSADGLIWHNHYRLDRALATIRWQALTLGRLLGIPVAPLLCVHHAHVQGGGLRAHGVAIVPATLLHSALGYEQVLSDAEVALYAATAKARLRPAA